MMKNKLLLIALLSFPNLFGGPNCEAYRFYGDTLKYEACVKCKEIGHHYQFSRKFQEILDEALETDSTFAYPYRQKSVAYLKSGDFITWKQLIDKAVFYDSTDNLGYRASCRFQFFRDYQGAINDIEELESWPNAVVGYSTNGNYNLIVVKAVSYKQLGEVQKAVDIMDAYLRDENHFTGLFDYLHLGVMYLELEKLDLALAAFQKQVEVNDIAESQYYMAKVYEQMHDTQKCQIHLQKARDYYTAENRMFESYVNPIDKIFMSDILSLEQELQASEGP